MLQPLDPHRAVKQTRGRRLPHWFQDGSAVFVTTRLADSIPAAFVARWEKRKTRLLLRHGIDPLAIKWQNRLRDATPEAYAIWQRRRSRGLLAMLDRGHGVCVLRQRWAAELVLNALRFYDGVRYDLGPVVVMPNHVHALLALREGFDLKAVMFDWKRFTARSINRRMDRTGQFWQHESFDRLVRNAAALERTIAYIHNNPRHLAAGEFLLWDPA